MESMSLHAPSGAHVEVLVARDPKVHADVLAHFKSLSPEDLELRFGRGGLHDPQRLEDLVGRVLQRSSPEGSLFGVRDEQCRLVLVGHYHAPDPGDVHEAAGTVELAMSVVPGARGKGLWQAALSWVLQQALHQDKRWLSVGFSLANEAVRKALGNLNVPIRVEGARGVACIDLEIAQANAQALVGSLDALITATRETLARAEPQARL